MQVVARLRQKPKKDTPGFLYAMRFSSGAVKVGRTGNLAARKKQHAANAEVHGHRLEEVWSVWVSHQKFGEQLAIGAACSLPDTAKPTSSSLEWWMGVDFEALLAELARDFGPGTRRLEGAAPVAEEAA